MDTKTLSFTIVLVGSALALLSIILAVYRKERGLTIYSIGFISAVGGFLLLMTQPEFSFRAGVILANVLLMFFHLNLAWGLRTCFRIRPYWPVRFWFYSAAWGATFLAAIWILDSYTFRAVLASSFIILFSFEFLLALRQGARELPAVLRRAGYAVALSFIGFHTVRIGLILAGARTGSNLMDDNFLNAFTFSFSVFFSVLWGGLILILDAANILSKLERKNRALSDLATSDELTGLFNRHMLETGIPSEMERAVRYRTPLSLILFDLDHFKRVNDDLGHEAGDAVLKRAAAIARNLIREPDSLYRWGGEEFLLMAPHPALAGGVALAEKLRQAIASDSFIGGRPVTASFGVAEWRLQDSREEWFKQADQALYRAKNSGRDRVVSFGNEDAMPMATVKLEWRREWESGNRLVDDGHRRLWELSNELLDLSLSKGTAEEIKPHLDALLAHVVQHFKEEENILAEVDYPELKAHARLHEDLAREAQEMKSEVERGEINPMAFFDFLVSRVVFGHILHADLLFFPCLRRR